MIKYLSTIDLPGALSIGIPDLCNGHPELGLWPDQSAAQLENLVLACGLKPSYGAVYCAAVEAFQQHV